MGKRKPKTFEQRLVAVVKQYRVKLRKCDSWYEAACTKIFVEAHEANHKHVQQESKHANEVHDRDQSGYPNR
jgi:hypothetical protein